MRSLVSIVWVIGTFVLFAHSANPRLTPQKESTSIDPTSIDPTSIVIVFKDGHQETFAMADIARIEYKDAGDATLGLDHFLGKWEAGDEQEKGLLSAIRVLSQATDSLQPISCTGGSTSRTEHSASSALPAQRPRTP